MAWIQQRVGIKQRHIASEHETTSYMATEAARDAITRSDINYTDIDIIICATGTPDWLMPSTASIIQNNLNITGIPAFDISAACSGFIYALDIAKNYITSGSAKNILIVAAERMSRVIDWTDRSTCVLFGDGAGAVVLSLDNKEGILASALHSDGSKQSLLNICNPLPKTIRSQPDKFAYYSYGWSEGI